MRRGFFGDEDVDAFVLFVGGEDLLFVVVALGVDLQRGGFGAGLKSKKGSAELRTSGQKTNLSILPLLFGQINEKFL